MNGLRPVPHSLLTVLSAGAGEADEWAQTCPSLVADRSVPPGLMGLTDAAAGARQDPGNASVSFLV